MLAEGGSGGGGGGGGGEGAGETGAEDACPAPAVSLVLAAVAQQQQQQQQGDGTEEGEASVEVLRGKYETLLNDHQSSLSQRLTLLRKLIVVHGLPPEDADVETAGADGGEGGGGAKKKRKVKGCTFRGLVWKILLGSLHMDAMHYMELVQQGPSWMDYKIRQDTFRTFRTLESFWKNVDEDQMIRVLNGFARLNFFKRGNSSNNTNHSQNSGNSSNSSGSGPGSDSRPQLSGGAEEAPGSPVSPYTGEGGYVQGMNVLVGPFLLVMPEVDAFFCFNAFATRHCPRYVLKNLDGVHHACDLVARLIAELDPQLHAHLEYHGLNATIYAFPLALSFMACFSPLSEVLKLWDFLFAAGVHLNVVAVVARLMLMRQDILDAPSPMMLLLPRELVKRNLDAGLVIKCVKGLMNLIPRTMLSEIILHPVESWHPNHRQSSRAIAALDGTDQGNVPPAPKQAQRSSSQRRFRPSSGQPISSNSRSSGSGSGDVTPTGRGSVGSSGSARAGFAETARGPQPRGGNAAAVGGSGGRGGNSGGPGTGGRRRPYSAQRLGGRSNALGSTAPAATANGSDGTARLSGALSPAAGSSGRGRRRRRQSNSGDTAEPDGSRASR